MKTETKIYSDFIKINKIKVGLDHFFYNNERLNVLRDDDGMWYADNEDKCYTKKAAIYWYIKNRI